MQGILATFFFQRHLCRRTTVLEVLLKIRSFTGCIPGETCTYVLGKYSNMFKKRCTVYMIHRMVVTHVSISMEDSTVGVHHRGTFQSPRHIRYVNEPDVPMTETVRGPPDHSCPSPITWGKLSPCLKYKEENCSPRSRQSYHSLGTFGRYDRRGLHNNSYYKFRLSRRRRVRSLNFCGSSVLLERRPCVLGPRIRFTGQDKTSLGRGQLEKVK